VAVRSGRFDEADLWAIGCIFAELLSLRPIFKGDEAKLDGKKTLPFQRDQMGRICEILGVIKRGYLVVCLPTIQYRP
jgi:hypothetical protein